MFELLNATLISYVDGIKSNIQRQVDNLLIPDDVFGIGKSLVMNLMHMQTIQHRRAEGESKKNGSDEEMLA